MLSFDWNGVYKDVKYEVKKKQKKNDEQAKKAEREKNRLNQENQRKKKALEAKKKKKKKKPLTPQQKLGYTVVILLSVPLIQLFFIYYQGSWLDIILKKKTYSKGWWI